MSAFLRARVTGKVQGVFFRDSAAKEARRLGLSGWVANEGDGSVSVEAEGSREALEEFLAWLSVGPPSARVKGVEHEWGEFSSRFSGFHVRR